MQDWSSSIDVLPQGHSFRPPVAEDAISLAMSRRHEFGTKLRQSRERRGTSLESISRDTKVSRSLFNALEQGNCSRWPTGVYSRAYVRSYADAIGLSGAEVVAEFCECFPEVAFPGAAPDAEERRVRDAGASPPLRLTFAGPPQRWRAGRRVLGALGDVLLIGLGALLLTLGGIGFWMAVAAVSLVWHVVSSTLPQRSVVQSLTDTSSRQWLARRRTPKVESPEEDSAGSLVAESVVHSMQ
jgi:transcriptional regulator with XRE-family HTH domain